MPSGAAGQFISYSLFQDCMNYALNHELINIKLERYFVQINDFLLLYLCFWKMIFDAKIWFFWLDFSDFETKIDPTPAK